MSKAPSMDLRNRFKQLVQHGMRPAAAGMTLLLSRATAARWGRKVRDGASLEPLPSGPRNGSGKLAPSLPFLVELIEQDRDISLRELRAALMTAHGVKCSIGGIDALLRRNGYTYKRELIDQMMNPGPPRSTRHKG